jgi:hypothetical protein
LNGLGTREWKRKKGNTEAQRTQRGVPRSYQRNAGDPLSETARSCFASLRSCTFAFISSLSFELASNLEEGIEDRFADVVEFRLKMIDEFMQSVIHDLFDV